MNQQYKTRVDYTGLTAKGHVHQSLVVLFNRSLKIMEITGDAIPKTYGENPLSPQASDFRVITKDESTGYGVIALRSYQAGEPIAVIAG